jgi:hypothetical protein
MLCPRWRKSFGTAFQASRTWRFNSAGFYSGYNFFIQAQTCPIGSRSGELAGQSSNYIGTAMEGDEATKITNLAYASNSRHPQSISSKHINTILQLLYPRSQADARVLGIAANTVADTDLSYGGGAREPTALSTKVRLRSSRCLTSSRPPNYLRLHYQAYSAPAERCHCGSIIRAAEWPRDHSRTCIRVQDDG